MKNRLTTMYNLFPRNPTQTAYIRFLKGVRQPLESGWTAARQSFDDATAARWRNRTKSAYSELLEDDHD